MEPTLLSYLTFAHFSCHINDNSLIEELELLVVSIKKKCEQTSQKELQGASGPGALERGRPSGRVCEQQLVGSVVLQDPFTHPSSLPPSPVLLLSVAFHSSRRLTSFLLLG